MQCCKFKVGAILDICNKAYDFNYSASETRDNYSNYFNY